MNGLQMPAFYDALESGDVSSSFLLEDDHTGAGKLIKQQSRYGRNKIYLKGSKENENKTAGFMLCLGGGTGDEQWWDVYCKNKALTRVLAFILVCRRTTVGDIVENSESVIDTCAGCPRADTEPRHA